MVRIRFLERAVYDTDGPGKGPVYEAGQEVEVSRDQADRWLRRLVAEELPPQMPEVTEAAPEAPATEPPVDAASAAAPAPATEPPAPPASRARAPR